MSSPLVVEWRALTVALLDRIAVEMRRLLGLNADELPLARVLEGGTWRAGPADGTGAPSGRRPAHSRAQRRHGFLREDRT